MIERSVRAEYPRNTREIENTWIPMPDGTRLAARIWLPEDAEADPVPAILEYLPYRKRDGKAERDEMVHPYFAGHGYAGVRVDMRGTGDSDGICLGEYLLQEQEDALVVLEWLAAQPWCSGKVGMIGISWGGFNGLQIAARQPEALGAVISLCSTDDRYADDIHYMGGAMLTDHPAWAATAFAIVNTPPDPALVGERWRDMWLERLDNNGLWLIDWLRHQRRDGFWQHGSICEDYSAVQVPVYAVGGYADGYTNPIFRMMENLPGPRKALIGPWAHQYPMLATPGPQIGFLQECLRWWDQHLKGIDTGIMDEPMIRAWMQEATPPTPAPAERPGRWVAETAWPGPGVMQEQWHLSDGALAPEAPAEARAIVLRSPETAGHTAQRWCMYGRAYDGALDQSEEAGKLTFFDSAPLAEDMDLLGFPMLRVRVASDVPQANLSAVLSVVAPDGKATLASYGALNLTHRTGHAAPEPLSPGEEVAVTVQLNAIGQRIPAGYRLRLALGSAYWPTIFPSASKATLRIAAGTAQLELPVRPAPVAEALPPFEAPETAAPLRKEVLQPGAPARRRREIDYATGREVIEQSFDSGLERHLQTDLVLRTTNLDRYEIHTDDPNAAKVTCHWTKSFARGDWQADLEASLSMEALPEVWRVTASLTARDQDGVVAERHWQEDIPRDLV